MGDWPILDVTRFKADDATSSTSVVANATANTKGAWTQVYASTAFDFSGLLVSAYTGANNVGVLFDIGIGAAGSEQAVVSNLMIMNLNGYNFGTAEVPIAIPGGTRVALRSQASVGSASSTFRVVGWQGGFPRPGSFTRATTYGANTASSRGTSATGGSNSWGSWVQLTAATTNPIRALTLNVGSSTLQTFGYNVQLGIGGAGSEQVILDAPWYADLSGTSGGFPSHPVFLLIPALIPSGNRLAVRLYAAVTVDFLVVGYD